MKYLFCTILLGVAVALNMPFIGLVLGILFTSIKKSHQNFIDPKLGTKLLQAGIIIIGLTINSSSAINLISEYYLQISLFVLTVFFVGMLLAKAFKISTSLGLLISSGTAICGATAIAAVAPIIKSKPKELLIALSIIFIFNAVALGAFPFVGQALDMSYNHFGAWVAMAIHDTGSVVGAAMSYGGNSAEVAATLKLGRTIWLIPLIIILGMLNSKNGMFKLPIFIMLFILAIFVGSIFSIKNEIIFVLDNLSDALIIAALFCIGTQINYESIKQANLRAISFAFVLWIFALTFSYILLMLFKRRELMFSHVMIGTNDIEESRAFYDKLFEALGSSPGKLYPNLTGQKRYFYNFNGSSFVISEPIDGNAATVANGSTIGFNIENIEQGNAWHQAGVENGGASIEQPPGIRNYEKFSMYLAYLRDPTGHKLCAAKLID